MIARDEQRLLGVGHLPEHGLDVRRPRGAVSQVLIADAQALRQCLRRIGLLLGAQRHDHVGADLVLPLGDQSLQAIDAYLLERIIHRECS